MKDHARKSFLYIFIIVSLFCGCVTFHYSSEDLIGTYAQIREDGANPFINLTINKTGFVLVDVMNYNKRGGGKYMCCDTIAYGSWKLDNKHGDLSFSTSQLSDTYIDDSVREETNANRDSVFFYINNPIEKKMGKKHEYIFYKIDLYSIGSAFGEDLYEKQFNTNRIVAANPNHDHINEFSIQVYTTPDYFARNIAIDPVKTFYYKVKDRNTNSFRINIPDLTYGYITYLRLNERLIKIVNKNELIWDGIKYRRLQ
jgi:hypothetical protein